VALWEEKKTIGKSSKNDGAGVPNEVEKKKKIVAVNLTASET